MGFKVRVEVVLFFAFFGFLLTESVNTNLIIYRTCYVILGLDKHNCSLLGNTNNNITRELEKLVQPTANVVSMVKTTVDAVAAALLCLIIGAWSDRFGRKPVIVVNLIGFTIMMLLMVLFSAIETASPWYMMISSIPVMLTGGRTSLLTVLLAYLTDVTSKQHRGFKIVIFEGVMATASLLGSSLSSYILNSTSYEVVFLVGAMSCLLGLLYTIFLLPESLDGKETQNRIKGLFKTQNILDMFKTTFRSRLQYNRSIILLVMFASALYTAMTAGDGSVMFMFMRAKFHWTLGVYTRYTSVTSIIMMAGGTFLVYGVHIKLKVKESIMIFSGFISMMLGMMLQGLAEVDWLIYAASVVKIPSASISPMTTTLISKSVNGDEVAKVFSVFIIIQSLLGLVGSPVYTVLYNATLDTNPGIFNFVTAGGNVATTCCLLAVLIFQKKTVVEADSLSEEENSKPEENSIHIIDDNVCDQENLVKVNI